MDILLAIVTVIVLMVLIPVFLYSLGKMFHEVMDKLVDIHELTIGFSVLLGVVALGLVVVALLNAWNGLSAFFFPSR